MKEDLISSLNSSIIYQNHQYISELTLNPLKEVFFLRSSTKFNLKHAAKAINPQVGTIIGKALQNKDTSEAGVIEVAVGRV